MICPKWIMLSKESRQRAGFTKPGRRVSSPRIQAELPLTNFATPRSKSPKVQIGPRYISCIFVAVCQCSGASTVSDGIQILPAVPHFGNSRFHQ
jgi:hypothetical protein